MAQSAPVSAREETSRSLDEHVQLQKLLQDLGYIPTTEKADGIYGAGMRTAISNFQTAENITADGILSDETAQRLLQKSAQPGAGGNQGVTARLDDLAKQYADLTGRINGYMSQQARKRQLLETVAEAESYAKEKSALALPAKNVAALTELLGDVEKVRANPEMVTLERFASNFKAIRETTEGAVTVLNATTPGNRFVMEGGSNDVIVLYNDSGKAPSLVKNMKGDLVFEGGKSSICQPHDGAPEKNFVKLVNTRLDSTGQQLAFPLSRCNAGDLGGYDLIVITRGLLQQSDSSSDTAAILKAVDGGLFKSMAAITDQDVNAVLQAEAARTLEIEKGIEDGSLKGFSLVVLKNDAADMCLAVAEGDRESHELLLKPHQARLTEEMKSAPAMRLSSIEDAFIAAKRGQCGAVYASESDLKSLTGALRRDQVAFRYLPILVEPKELAKGREQVIALAKERAEAEARAKIAEQEAKQRYAEFQQRVSHDASGDYILTLKDPAANGDICYYEDPEIAQKALDFFRERLKQQYPAFGMGGLFRADSFEALFSSQSCGAALVPAGDYEDVRHVAEHLVDQTFPVEQVRIIRAGVDARSEDRLKPYQSISDDYQCYSKLRSAARDACLAGVGYMAGWREADSIQLRAGKPVAECYGSATRQADWLAIGGSVAEQVYSRLRTEFRYDENLRNNGGKSLVYCDEAIITKAERIGFIPRAPMATVKKAIQGPTLTRSRSSATEEEEIYGPFSPGIWQSRAMGGRPDGQCDLTKSYTEFKDGKQYTCNLTSPNKCEVSTSRYRKVATNTYAQDLKNHELTLRRSENGTQVTPVSVELTDMDDLLKGWLTLWHAQSRLGIMMLGGSYRYKCKT
nr:peptidoglycan-binding protein [Microvirga solisilvae]